jgi:glutamate/tyrosine decarboxylase-like PLP-dependent enzyme
LTVVTFHVEDPRGVQGALRKAGFGVNVIPRFKGIRIVVNPHVTRKVIARFLAALKETTA